MPRINITAVHRTTPRVGPRAKPTSRVQKMEPPVPKKHHSSDRPRLECWHFLAGPSLRGVCPPCAFPAAPSLLVPRPRQANANNRLRGKNSRESICIHPRKHAVVLLHETRDSGQYKEQLTIEAASPPWAVSWLMLLLDLQVAYEVGRSWVPVAGV